MMGGVPDQNAVSRHQGTAPFSNVSTLDVSTVERGLLVAGTDDGVISVSRDDGATWEKHMRFPGVPDTAYVSKVRFSHHDADVLYATFDNHRSNDFHPYVIRSTDGGGSWENITHDLPEFGGARSFAEDPENPDLLFVGTETAPYVSFDRGGHWTPLDEDLPPVRVDDMKIHPRDGALVVATHGRGIYIVDDLTPLRALAGGGTPAEARLFPVQPDLQLTPDPSPTSGTRADRDYAAPNPPVGTTLWYVLPAAASEATLEIAGPDGRAVRTLDAPHGAGLHGVRWDFRVDAPYQGPPDDEDQGGGGFFGGRDRGGAPAVPGTYTARLTVDGTVLEQPVEVEPDPAVTLTAAQLRELFDVRMRQMRLDARLSMALSQSEEIQEQIQGARDAMKQVEVPASLSQTAGALASEISDIRDRLGARGGFFGGGGNENPPSVRRLVSTAGGVHRATAMPTAQEREALELAPDALAEQVVRINTMLTEDLPAFYQALDEAGVPWSPGRPIRE
jgi:hypothetical protein